MELDLSERHVAMQERFVTPAQLRAGRALLGLSQTELAGRACLSPHTVKQAEEGEAHASEAALAAIRVAPSGLLLRSRA
jgi:transcriptional regulator with XRE-family HTH domain